MTNEKFQYELDIQKFWQDKNIYQKFKDKNKGNKLFNTIDGPPYPTGEIHVGHLRNWAIKDSVLRFKRLQGYDVYARDGYDVQGLPVEEKVQKKLNILTVEDLRNFGISNFVKECKFFVKEVIDDMIDRRNRYGLSMDRESYQTSHPQYLSFAWRFFKEAHKKGLLYKSYKTVAWCPHDQTTLSDYEVKDTYKTLEDPSIYVKFSLKDEFTTTSYKESLVIWTTTPWTLQSNLAIAVNPVFDYAKILVKINDKEEVLIIGNSIVEQVINKFKNIDLIKVLEVIKGSELEGVKYNHIYLEETPSQQEFAKDTSHKNIHSVVLADYVTLDEGEDILEKLEKKGNYKHESVNKDNEKIKEKENTFTDGTGLVHIAPGHGQEDYEVGIKYNLPIFCPVGPNGCFTEGKYEGKYFKDVDPIAIQYLSEKGHMLYNELKSHRYPCCWRCKTPIVYRAADQWWIKRSEITQEIIKLNNNVKWFPDFAKDSFNNLMSNAGDWAISRQRFWGTPLPIFEDEDGNFEVFGSKEELEQRIGRTLDDIHADDLREIEIINKDSNKIMKAVPFIADVWFDSGCASFAAHYNEGLSFEEIIEKYYPIKWIMEGQDQIRGWFSSLFTVGYVLTGKAPYNEVVYNQFVMAKDGTKMSKSLGNGITGNEALENYGADATRFYLLTKRAPEDQLNFDSEELTNNVFGFFNTLENISNFMNSYLIENKESNFPTINYVSLEVEDKWILSKLNNCIQTVTRNLEHYKFNIAFKEVEEFLVRDLSKVYLKLVKDRTEIRDGNLITIFNQILKKCLLLLAPVIPFKTENLYQKLNLSSKKESIFLESFPEVDEYLLKESNKEGIEDNFDLVQDIIGAVLNSREKVKIGVRWPLSQIDIISSNNISNKLNIFEDLIKKLTNVLKVSYELKGTELNYNIKPNFATIKQDFENVSDVIKIINQNKKQIINDIKNNLNENIYDDLKIDYNKHLIKETILPENLISSDFKEGNVILHTIQDEILLEEGYLREITRRIQSFRKDLGLDKNQNINLSFLGSENYLIKIINSALNIISKKVGAKEILDKELENKQAFVIKDKKLVISIEKL